MPEFSLELATSTARLKCSCCNAGMTSVCGFISRNDRPYSVYYALIHNSRKDRFVRLSISVGEWWRHDTYENRHALCLDATLQDENLRLSVRDPMHSPQQDFPKFGHWLSADADCDDPLLQELIEAANFVITHDPAVLTYLAGQRPDYTGRDLPHVSEN